MAGEGIFDETHARPPLELGKRDRDGNDLRTLLSGTEPALSVDRRFFPTLDGEPRQGDRVEFPGRPDLHVYSVVSVERDGLSRLLMMLAIQFRT